MAEKWPTLFRGESVVIGGDPLKPAPPREWFLFAGKCSASRRDIHFVCFRETAQILVCTAIITPEMLAGVTVGKGVIYSRTFVPANYLRAWPDVACAGCGRGHGGDQIIMWSCLKCNALNCFGSGVPTGRGNEMSVTCGGCGNRGKSSGPDTIRMRGASGVRPEIRYSNPTEAQETQSAKGSLMSGLKGKLLGFKFNK